MTKSSTKVELVALNFAGEEIEPLKRMIEELGKKQLPIQNKIINSLLWSQLEEVEGRDL